METLRGFSSFEVHMAWNGLAWSIHGGVKILAGKISGT